MLTYFQPAKGRIARLKNLVALLEVQVEAASRGAEKPYHDTYGRAASELLALKKELPRAPR